MVKGPREQYLGQNPDAELVRDFMKPFGGDEVFHDYMMRIFAFEPDAIKNGHYPAIVRAFQLGEKTPMLGFKPEEGLNVGLRMIGLAATYRFSRVEQPEGKKPLFDVDTLKGIGDVSRMRVAELPLANEGAKRLYVVGRVANVGRTA